MSKCECCGRQKATPRDVIRWRTAATDRIEHEVCFSNIETEGSLLRPEEETTTDLEFLRDQLMSMRLYMRGLICIIGR